MLRETESKKLYINLFNVVVNQDTSKYKYAAIPNAVTEIKTGLPKDKEIVPVVYITNDAMKATDSAGIPILAQKLCHKVERMMAHYGADSVRELQIDCDWTRSTRDRYFYLLSCIKKSTYIPILSATIRLYQYKYYKKAGVPPVDRGVLMFYHMNAVREIESKELILDVEEGKKYLIAEKYPLPLDYALPVFSEMMVYRWPGVAFYSPATFRRLMADTVLKKVDTSVNQYTVTRLYDISEGDRLYPEEHIKMETAKIEDLEKAADLLSAQANSDTFSIIFFHLDRNANSTYTSHEIKDLISRFD